jgi:hypothetical protein
MVCSQAKLQKTTRGNLRRINLFTSLVTPPIIHPTITNNSITSEISHSKSLMTSLHEGFIGGFAGVVQVLCFMWLRTTVSYQYRYGLSMREAIRVLYLQGGISRFYRGITFALIQGPLSKFTAIASNDFSSTLMKHQSKSGIHMILTTGLGAILAALCRVVLMPIDTCKTVLQVEGKVGFNKLFTDVMFCIV